MIKIERNQQCVIVYDEDESRGIAFPSGENTDVKQYVAELQKCAEVIRPGIVLIPLLFDLRYKENSRPMQLFLESNDIQSVLEDDTTAEKLYKFYFEHAILQISPTSRSHIFFK